MRVILVKLLLIIFCVFASSVLSSQPIIRSFNPKSGTVGTTVDINGIGFSPIAGRNIVYFGSVKANVVGSSDTLISVTVPAGSSYQPITVTTDSLTAYSQQPFVVTFSGASANFNVNSFIPKMDITPGIYPHGVSMADFSGDGKPDLLVSKGSSSTVSILKNITSSINITFDTTIELTATGSNHEGTATGDFDGDGKIDFVITNSTGLHSISVFKNRSFNGNIFFAPKIDLIADNAPYNVAVGDLNGDGKPDIAVANNGSNKVSIFKNTSTFGRISFASRIDIEAGTNPYGIAIGDLDADGKADIAVAGQGRNSELTVIKNTHFTDSLSFDNPISLAVVPGSFTLSIADLDGDTKPELAVASSGSNSVFVIKNESVPGDISFGSVSLLPVGNYPTCVSIGDIDGDGLPDVTTTNRFSNTVSVLKNVSIPGSFSFQEHVDFPVDNAPIFLAVGDLNGDGRPEIAAANSSSSTVSVLTNIIGADLAPVISSFSPGTGNNGTTVKINGQNFSGTLSVTFGGVPASSFNIDSSSGITATVASGASGDVAITTAYGTATLGGFNYTGPIITNFTPTFGGAGTIVTIIGVNFTDATAVLFGGIPAASFTINSSTEITAVVGTGANGAVSVTTPNGTATSPGFNFGVPAITSVNPASGDVGSVVTINGSGFDATPSSNIVYFGAVRAIVTSATLNQLQVVVPNGATYKPISVTTRGLTGYSRQPFVVTFRASNHDLTASSFSVAANYPTGSYPTNIAFSDVNNDGKPDMVIVNRQSNSITILKNNSNRGSLSFGNRLNINTGSDPFKIAIGDLDGDGMQDIACTNFNSGTPSTISVFRNTSSGGNIAFSTQQTYSTGNGSTGIDIADLNGDGRPDIVVATGNSGIFSVFTNTTIASGTISFSERKDYTSFGHPDILTANLNNDRRPEIITSNFGDGNISIYPNISNSGALAIGPKVDYLAGYFPGSMIAVDLDMDDKQDLVVCASDVISYFRNASSNNSISFFPGSNYDLPASNFSVADFNGDGKPDISVGKFTEGTISVLQNTSPTNPDLPLGTPITIKTGNFDTYVAAGDLDGDNAPDIAVTNDLLNTVTILKNNLSQILLPVNLISFSAYLQQQKVKLEWRAENEQNLANYSIERSLSGSEFAKVAEIGAKGSRIYSFSDDVKDLSALKLYYRLKLVDRDGTVKYSAVNSVSIPSNNSLTVYPNPANTYIKLKFTENNTGKINVTIMDVNGKTIIRKGYDNSNSNITISTSTLSPGIYNIKVAIKGKLINQKLIIAR